MKRQILILPSILSADSSKLAEEIASVIGRAGANGLHCDYMDGLFVPQKTVFSPDKIKSIRSITGIFLDLHLMADNPNGLIGDFAEAGVDLITVHFEVCPDLRKTLETIKGSGIRAGVALKPETRIAEIEEYIGLMDVLLVMTVNPGRSGQRLIESCLEKIREASELIRDRAPNVLLEVDGGIDLDNIGIAAKKGANMFVSGNTIFKSSNRLDTIRMMRVTAQKARA